MKHRQDFQMDYPLSRQVVRGLKIVTETVGNLIVTGVAYCDENFSKLEYDSRYSLDIDFITWNGTDIKEVLEVTGGIEEIEEYVLRNIAELFEKEEAA